MSHPEWATIDWIKIVYLAIGVQLAALLPIRWSQGMQMVVAPPLVALSFAAPGIGPAAAVWLFTYDGRRPGRAVEWWALLFNRANIALSYGVPSLLLSLVHLPALIDVPLRSVAIAIGTLIINYPLTALLVADATGNSVRKTLLDNVGLGALRSTTLLCFAGGVLYDLLNLPYHSGYVIALGLFGFVFSVRANLADTQRQVQARIQTLQLAAQALDARDRYTESHSMRVAELAARIGEELGLGSKEIELLRTAGSLHDLGKIGVRDSILNKAGPLTPDEWEEMRRHPDIGADMIEKHSALASAAPHVRFHHEKWDGTGYPQGLRGESIPLGGRILAVADSFDTITAERIYRRSHMTPLEGVADISARAGRWYDPAVVNGLRALFGLEQLPVSDQPRLEAPVQSGELLRNRIFVRFVASTGVSALGDPLTLTAAMSILYSATRQPLALAGAYAAQALGAMIVGVAAGALADRWRRARLIPALEAVRALIVLSIPVWLAVGSYLVIFPAFFLLAAVEGVVQAARQAAVAEVVDRPLIAGATAIITAVGRLTWAAGGAIALVVLLATHSTNALFIADGLSFAVAGALVIGLGPLGGGVPVKAFRGISRAWSVTAARPHLLMAAGGAFFLSMSFPLLVVLAYDRAPHGYGSSAYGLLQFALGIGISVGAFLLSRVRTFGSMRAVATGLVITGFGSVALALATPLWLTALTMFVASIGNSVYAIANQSALLEAGLSENRGSIMAFRFGLGQVLLMLGTAAGGLLASRLGASGSFAVIGVGLLLLAALAAYASRFEIAVSRRSSRRLATDGQIVEVPQATR